MKDEVKKALDLIGNVSDRRDLGLGSALATLREELERGENNIRLLEDENYEKRQGTYWFKMFEELLTKFQKWIDEAGNQRARAETAEARLALLQPIEEAAGKVREFVDKQYTEVDEDERYHYKPANVEVNAPLALIQCIMAGRMEILIPLRVILDDPALAVKSQMEKGRGD